MFTLLQVAAHAPKTLDPWQLILSASLVVKIVMALLAGMSIASWFIIGAKQFQLWRASRESAKFLELFWSRELGNTWSAERLENIYSRLSTLPNSPIARVFHSGYVELAKVTGADGDSTVSDAPVEDIENIDRALKRSGNTEITLLENLLPFLATSGSTAPFIGLFGTVWGVMNSFIGIGNLGNASLAVVAPGIAEALIATAIGLAAAIPAVMAYNYFLRKIRVLENELSSFHSDYLNIVRRHFLRG